MEWDDVSPVWYTVALDWSDRYDTGSSHNCGPDHLCNVVQSFADEFADVAAVQCGRWHTNQIAHDCCGNGASEFTAVVVPHRLELKWLEHSLRAGKMQG